MVNLYRFGQDMRVWGRLSGEVFVYRYACPAIFKAEVISVATGSERPSIYHFSLRRFVSLAFGTNWPELHSKEPPGCHNCAA